jgi:signal transduction histidine kinase
MTIRLRLTLYWAAVLTAIVILSGAAVMAVFAREQWGQLDSALLEEADTAAATIQSVGAVAAAAATVRELAAERDLGPARCVQLLSGDRVLAEACDRGADLPRMIPPAGGPAAAGMVDGSRRAYRYALVPLTLAGDAAYLIDGVDARAVRATIARLREALLVILPLILATTVGCGYWLAGRALAPIGALAAGLGGIEARELDRRLARGSVEDEVARLTDAINALLVRVAHASEAERRFAADAAHELRTPLAVLRAGLEIAVARERSGPEYADAISAAIRETMALCQMSDELLALARLDHDVTVARSPIQFGPLVREVTEAVEPLLEAKQLELRDTLDAEVIVNGDRDYLRRLIVNLLDNALKFTPPQGWIAVGLRASDGVATLRIADSGPAIAADDLPRIFDRFFRSKSSGTAGSGLGLSLCREIARIHGGEIYATNLASGGAEFVVTLPMA